MSGHPCQQECLHPLLEWLQGFSQHATQRDIKDCLTLQKVFWRCVWEHHPTTHSCDAKWTIITAIRVWSSHLYKSITILVWPTGFVVTVGQRCYSPLLIYLEVCPSKFGCTFRLCCICLRSMAAPDIRTGWQQASPQTAADLSWLACQASIDQIPWTCECQHM
jgi:hypothetical protein